MPNVSGSDFMDTRDVPRGAVAEVTYHSTAVKTFRRMHVYTPPGYDTKNDKYPVFYLLHGAGDSDDAWSSVGRAGFILDNQVSGVGGHDAVFPGQVGDFVAQLGVFAVQPNFIEQISHPPCRPQAGNEIVFGTFGREMGFIGELLFGAIDGAFDGDRGIAFARIASDEHQLFAFEKVG